jgi:hypothetical protein
LRGSGESILNASMLAYIRYLIFARSYIPEIDLRTTSPERILNYSASGWYLV